MVLFLIHIYLIQQYIHVQKCTYIRDILMRLLHALQIMLQV